MVPFGFQKSYDGRNGTASFLEDSLVNSHLPFKGWGYVFFLICRHPFPGFVEYKNGCTRLASDKAYQLLAHGRWFSPDTPAYSTTKTGRHDIAEILHVLSSFVFEK
jgi:hypothetical protein